MCDSSDDQLFEIEPPCLTGPPYRDHRRSRTTSLISTSSLGSFNELFDFTVARRSSAVNGRSAKYDVSGSFVLNGSATAALQHLTSYQSPRSIPSAQSKRRRVILLDSSPRYDIETDSPSSVTRPTIPSISRTLSHSTIPYPPSPTSSTSSTCLLSDEVTGSDLHPILASLERKSKFCTKTIYCSTCRKPGSDYPRCGKCGDMWCSRECRLLGGKRHVCSSFRKDNIVRG